MAVSTTTRSPSTLCKLLPSHLLSFWLLTFTLTSLPLYHFVTADLPSNTKAPELDDVNAAAALRADAAWSGVDASAGAGVTEELVGLYASYLVQTGFLPSPTIAGARPLPALEISEEQKKTLLSVGGRGGTA